MKYLYLNIESSIKIERVYVNDFILYLMDVRENITLTEANKKRYGIIFIYSLEKMLNRFITQAFNNLSKQKKNLILKFNLAELSICSILFNEFKIYNKLLFLELAILNRLK